MTKSGSGRSRALPLGLALLLLSLAWFVQGPRSLGVRPPIYHDESVLYDGATSILDQGQLGHPLFSSRPELEEALEGRGKIDIVLSAGYHYLLAAWSAVVGVGLVKARLLGSLCALLIGLMLLRLGQRLTGSWWPGALAGVWWTLDPSVNDAARTLRPDVPTSACHLGGALLALELGRHTWARFASGLLVGLGLTMHPVGAVVAPAAAWILWANRGQRSVIATLLPFALGLAVPLLPYVWLLWARWAEVSGMLDLHASQRVLAERSYGSRLLNLLASRKPNAYSMSFGRWLDPVLVLGAALALGGLFGRYRLRARSRRGLALVIVCTATAWLLFPILARDYVNFLYLANLLPWIFMTAAVGLYLGLAPLLARAWAASGRGRVSPGALAAGVCAGVAAFFALQGLRAYQLEDAPYRGVASVPAIAAQMAPSVPAGSIVLGTPNAVPLVRAADAIYLHNDVYVQYKPPYARYPVQVTRDGSHLRSYAFDHEALDRLARDGRRVFFHLDTFDWAWNTYAPFGQYAASFVDLRRGLEERFTLVARAYSRQRGRIELWELGGSPQPHKTFVEDFEVSLGPAAPLLEGQSPSAFDLTDSPIELQPVARWQTRAGRRYWLEVWLRVEGEAMVALAVDGVSQARWFDAPQAVPFDLVLVAGDQPVQLEVFAAQGSARAVVERVSLRPVGLRPVVD